VARPIEEQGTDDWCGLRQDRRAISGPLTPVTSGFSRSLADTPPRRSGHVTGPDGTDSQADSAGSIPVTRSNVKVQFGEVFRTLDLRSFWGRIAPRAINVPLGAPSSDCQLVGLPSWF